MRCYHFGNFYMQGIQQGIQAAHCQMELALKYSPLMSDGRTFMFWDWAENHKTMICLNAGAYQDMVDLWEFLDTEDNPFPHAKFHESPEAMNGLLTNIAIVLPPKIYEASSFLRSWNRHCTFNDNGGDKCFEIEFSGPIDIEVPDSIFAKKYTEFEYNLVNRLNNYSLAR